MSHFSVIVIGPDPEKQLAPYHEFECTGEDDEYVQTIDQTEDVRAEYAASTCTRLRSPAGSLHAPYGNEFYRDPTPEEQVKIGRFAGTGGGNGLSWHSQDWADGRGYRTKIKFIPDGWAEITVPRSEVETFAEYVAEYHGKSIVPFGQEPDLSGEHKYGYALTNEVGEVVKVVDRTNPNKRWDWYAIGGRWTGFFPTKPGKAGAVGSPGLMTNPAKPGTADQCAWGDVDFGRAKAEAAAEAGVRFDKWNDIVALYGRPKSWDQVREEMGDTSEARDAYHAQGAIREKKVWGCPVAEYGFDRAAYVAKCVAKALVPFAVVKDGQWYERGKMGWWGCVADEQDHETWCAKVAELFDALSPDTLVTMVDCHI